MIFSISSLLTMTFFSSILIVLIYFVLRNNHTIAQLGMRTLALCIGATILRLLIPFELPITRNLPIEKLLPNFILFLETPVIKFDKSTISLLHILYLIWAIGIIIQISKTIIVYFRFTKTVTNTLSLTDSEIQKALCRIITGYDKPLSFRIIQANIISTPMVFGVFRPKILLPKIKLTEEEWYFILNHEISHYICGDLWVKFLVEILCTIYWWNPFVYLFRNQISKAQEIHIDLSVTKSMNEAERIKYLECLLKIAKIPTCKGMDKWILSFNGESANVLSQRFNIILNHYASFNKTKRRNYLTFLLPVILLLVLSFSIVFEPYSIAPQDASYTVELTTQDAYLIQNPENGYDVYFSGQFYGHINEIKDSFSDLPIYKNTTEVPHNEKNK